MSKNTWVPMLILIVFVGVVVIVFNLNQTVLLDYNLAQEDYNGIFLNLALIALIIERFIEVFNSIWRRGGRLVRVRAVETASDDAAKATAQRALDEYRAETATYAMYGGFALGLVVAIAGVHTLQVFYDVTTLSGNQKLLFQSADIVLTAGLLAGGSKGINGMTSLIGSWLDQSKAQVQKPVANK